MEKEVQGTGTKTLSSDINSLQNFDTLTSGQGGHQKVRSSTHYSKFFDTPLSELSGHPELGCDLRSLKILILDNGIHTLESSQSPVRGARQYAPILLRLTCGQSTTHYMPARGGARSGNTLSLRRRLRRSGVGAIVREALAIIEAEWEAPIWRHLQEQDN